MFLLGFGECWFQQSVGDIQAFISIADQRIKDQYFQQWHGNLESSTHARTYRTLRPNFTSQTYLQCIHSSEHLKSLARFVTSSHRLRVETGRWDKPSVPYAQHKCQICDIEIEDEFNFMFVCPLNNADRTKLLPSMQRFIDLMNKTNPRLVNRIAKFIYRSFKSRMAYFSHHWFWCVCVINVINVWYSKFPLMNCSAEVFRVVWFIINVQNACVSELMLFVTSCHCNYVHILSCTGLWPYWGSNKLWTICGTGEMSTVISDAYFGRWWNKHWISRRIYMALGA